MNQRTFLGLTHNPFVPPKEGFYAGGDRKTHLDHLRHLSQWSRHILVVTGGFGVGKSTLFRELSANLEPQTKAARIAGTLVNTERQVLSGLMQGFGIAESKNASADDLADLIISHVAEQSAGGRTCMIMADDAHLFEPNALQRLVSLVAGGALRMVLFAETSLIQTIDRAAKQLEQEWFEIRLTGFPKSEVRDYLEWRFSQAQYRGRLPFTNEQLDMLSAKSGGNPGIIDSLASNLLVEMETGELHKQRRGFPAVHGLLTLLLVVLVGLVYLFVQPDSQLAGSGGYQVVVQKAPAETAVIPDTDVLPPQGTSPVEIEGSSVTNTDNGQVDPDRVEAPLEVAEPGADPQVGVPIEPVAAAAPEAVERTPAPLPPTPLQQHTSGETGEQEGNREPDKQGEQEAQQPVDPVPERATVENRKPTAPPPGRGASIPVEDASPGYRNAQWLLAQSPELYTLQLVTLSDRQRAIALINRQKEPSEFAIYQIRRNGKLLYVVTYGLFSSSSAATSAAAGLTGELGRLQAWVRPLQLVQDAIRVAG